MNDLHITETERAIISAIDDGENRVSTLARTRSLGTEREVLAGLMHLEAEGVIRTFADGRKVALRV